MKIINISKISKGTIEKSVCVLVRSYKKRLQYIYPSLIIERSLKFISIRFITIF